MDHLAAITPDTPSLPTSAAINLDDKSQLSPDQQEITGRFETLIGAIRTAGFRDVDQMVLAYYTADFKKNSLPAISQQASRTRRLKMVVRVLQEHSEQWPRRESCGLQEGLMEAASESLQMFRYRLNLSLLEDDVECSQYPSTNRDSLSLRARDLSAWKAEEPQSVSD